MRALGSRREIVNAEIPPPSNGSFLFFWSCNCYSHDNNSASVRKIRQSGFCPRETPCRRSSKGVFYFITPCAPLSPYVFTSAHRVLMYSVAVCNDVWPCGSPLYVVVCSCKPVNHQDIVFTRHVLLDCHVPGCPLYPLEPPFTP